MNVFPISAAMLDALVLSVCSSNDCYGYQITKDIQQMISVSESTLYPVLRRLQKNGALETYDMPYQGRNRRYYKITPFGSEMLYGYKNEWSVFRQQIDFFLDDNKGGIS